MKSLTPISITAFSVLALLSSSSFAKPLTIDDIRAAKKIGIMPGSFDPITQGHIAAAMAAIEKGGVDIVILTPMENPHKDPIARVERLKMIDLAASTLDKVVYAKEGGDLYSEFSEKKIWTVVDKIRELNPGVEIDLVAGSDFDSNIVTTEAFKLTSRPDRWVVINRPGEASDLSKVVLDAPHVVIDAAPTAENISSSNAKKYLQTHLELYSETPANITTATVPGLELAVEKYILTNGFYKEPTKPGVFQKILGIFWKP
jgi:nicotinate-nucleotide adenylyltransferase